MDACDIDKLRELVRRQHYAKREHYDPRGFGSVSTLSAEDCERQLLTYIAQNTTVAALTKCVEAVETEARSRVKDQREKYERREEKQRIIRVCQAAAALAKDDKKTAGEAYNDYYVGKVDWNKLVRDAEYVIRKTGDLWSDE